MNPTLHARARFGMGATAGDLSLAHPRGWLLEQVRPGGVELAGESLPTPAEVGSANRSLIDAQRSRDPDAIRGAREEIRELVRREVAAALRARVASEAPFAERLVAFWPTHLCVPVPATPPIAAPAGLYERQAIRPHVFGRFEEMVLVSARHPAMLVYRDNAASIGPDSEAARALARRGRERGLNENYARELHTLDVVGGSLGLLSRPHAPRPLSRRSEGRIGASPPGSGEGAVPASHQDRVWSIS